MTVDDIITQILRREGGYVDHPMDRGGPTNRGVILPTLSAWLGRSATLDELKALTEAEARTLYHDMFVKRPGLGIIGSPRVLGLAIDMAVNHGPGNAIRMIQRILRVQDDGVLGPITKEAIRNADWGKLYSKLVAERGRFYGRIITKDHSQAGFAAGWMNRLGEFIEELT